MEGSEEGCNVNKGQGLSGSDNVALLNFPLLCFVLVLPLLVALLLHSSPSLFQEHKVTVSPRHISFHLHTADNYKPEEELRRYELLMKSICTGLRSELFMKVCQHLCC